VNQGDGTQAVDLQIKFWKEAKWLSKHIYESSPKMLGLEGM